MKTKFDLKERFIKTLIESSEEEYFEKACVEWELDKILKTNKPNYSCICGHVHIKQLCYIKNTNNKNILLVGSDCIGRFMKNIKVKFYFNGRDQLIKDGIPNKYFVDFLYNKNIINDYVYKFYNKMYNKKKYTKKQREFKTKINQQVLFQLRKHEINIHKLINNKMEAEQ